MKIETDYNKGFRPIKITLTMETSDDLYALWHRTNVHMDLIKEVSGSKTVPYPKNQYITHDLWNTLNDLLIDMKLKQYEIKKERGLKCAY